MGCGKRVDQLLVDLTAFLKGCWKRSTPSSKDKELVYTRETRGLTVNGILLYDDKEIAAALRQDRRR